VAVESGWVYWYHCRRFPHPGSGRVALGPSAGAEERRGERCGTELMGGRGGAAATMGGRGGGAEEAWRASVGGGRAGGADACGGCTRPPAPITENCVVRWIRDQRCKEGTTD
jgi:hypothetical protein